MTKHKVVKEIELPKGVEVGERPENIELFARGGQKWIPIIEKLQTLKATESLRYDLSSSPDLKKATSSIRSGLKLTAEKMGVKGKLRFALIGIILHVWIS